MPSHNRITLIGHVGKDPEARVMQNGDTVVSFSLATSERWTGRDGQKQEHTDWHRVDVWGQQAKFVRDYVVKGSLLYVEGSMRYEDWNDKDGNKRMTPKVRGQRVIILDKKQRDADQAPSRGEVAATVSDEDLPF